MVRKRNRTLSQTRLRRPDEGTADQKAGQIEFADFLIEGGAECGLVGTLTRPSLLPCEARLTFLRRGWYGGYIEPS